MGFPLYKEWMCEINKVGDVHVKGVKDFVKYAKRNLKREEISCPCVRCRNGKCLKWTEVELHLVKWGMQQDYMFWKFHGEREFPYIPNQLPVKETIQVEDDHLAHPRLNDLINEAYGIHAMQANHTPEVDVLREEEENDRDHREGSTAHFDSGVDHDNDYQITTSSQQEGPSLNSLSTTPQTAQFGTDLRPEVVFNLSGGIIGGKTALKNRCLALLRTQIGLAYDDWRQVEQAKKDDIWDTLFAEFKMPADRKEEVLKEMGMQLKMWRRNLCSKYFEGLDSDGIKALKDKVPEKEKIHISQWNEFIKCETSEAKIKQRDRCKASRAKKTDVHCLDRMSCAEKAEEMMRKVPLRRAPECLDVFVESRKQKKTGEFHSKTAEEMLKLTELKSSQDSSSETTLESDPLTILYGKDGRGRTRGAGPVSRSKLKTATPICSEIVKVVKRSNMQMEQDMREIKQSLNILLGAYFEGQKFPPQQMSTQPFLNAQPFPPQPGSLSNPSNLAIPSYPTPASSSSCDIFSLSNTKKIATGVIVSTATPGTVVHGHVLLEYECKVQVIDVVPGEERHGLYLESQGGATTIKETEGGWVVWPICLLR